MSERIISLTGVVILLLAGAALLHSCAGDEPVKVSNGEDGIEAWDVAATGDVADERDTMPTNGEDGAEDKVDSVDITAALQEIDDMKDYLEQLLDDNYDVFNQIVKCFENDSVNYHCRVEEGEIVVWYSNPITYVDLGEIEVGEQIVYVINELGFISIDETENYVDFPMINGDRYPYGGTYAQALLCNKFPRCKQRGIQDGGYEREETPQGSGYLPSVNKSNAGENGIQEDNESGGEDVLGGSTHIRDQWFYNGFWMGH